MKRVWRFTFGLVAALSLLLCVATAGMWVRSYYVGDLWLWRMQANPVWWDLLALRGVGVFNSGNGVIELVIDSPPVGRLPATTTPERIPDLIPWSYPGISPYLFGGTHSVRLSLLGLGWEEFTGWPSRSSNRPPVGQPLPVVMSRWTIPYWLIQLMTIILPLIWLRAAVKRWKKHDPNLCIDCGYDLRATPARCPECGQVPEAAEGVAR